MRHPKAFVKVWWSVLLGSLTLGWNIYVLSVMKTNFKLNTFTNSLPQYRISRVWLGQESMTGIESYFVNCQLDVFSSEC